MYWALDIPPKIDMPLNKETKPFYQPLFNHCIFFQFHYGSLSSLIVCVLLLSSLEMDTATPVQVLEEADLISRNTNTLGKGMDSIILRTTMGK